MHEAKLLACPLKNVPCDSPYKCQGNQNPKAEIFLFNLPAMEEGSGERKTGCEVERQILF